MIAFTLWFGAWGAVAAYVGCVIGAGIPEGLLLSVNLCRSLADLWQVWICSLGIAKGRLVRYCHASLASYS